MESVFELKIRDPELAEKARKDPQLLLDLCRKEVALFDRKLRSSSDPNYSQGMVPWERAPVEGYIYQKTKGHLDAQTPDGDSDSEASDG